MASEINGLDTSAANSALQNSRMESLAKLKMTATDTGHLSEAQKNEYSKAARGFESMFVRSKCRNPCLMTSIRKMART